jgi:hypothetical protein
MDPALREELQHMIGESSRVLTNALEANSRQNANFQDNIQEVLAALAGRVSSHGSVTDGGTAAAGAPMTTDDAAPSAPHGGTVRTSGGPTIVNLPEKDPHFPDWDGDRGKLLLWLHHVDQIRQTKQLPDAVAVRYARGAMGVGAYGHFDGKGSLSWKAFVDILYARFMPSDIASRLMTELYQQKMVGHDFNLYFSTFMAYRQYLPSIDQTSLVIAFKNGLEPALKYAVDQAQPQTLDEACEVAWTTHLGPTPPWKDYVDQASTHVVATVHQQLEQFSREAAQYVTSQQAEFLAQQADRLAAPTKAPTLATAAGLQSDPATFGPVLQYGRYDDLPEPEAPVTNSWNFPHRANPAGRPPRSFDRSGRGGAPRTLPTAAPSQHIPPSGPVLQRSPPPSNHGPVPRQPPTRARDTAGPSGSQLSPGRDPPPRLRRAETPPPVGRPCYNCGRMGHWSRTCPEPRRTRPAAALQPLPDSDPSPTPAYPNAEGAGL